MYSGCCLQLLANIAMFTHCTCRFERVFAAAKGSSGGGVSSSSRRSFDIISMLVNIYGSKDMFVKEYETLLADRLLASCSYDIQKEIRYLELLKLR